MLNTIVSLLNWRRRSGVLQPMIDQFRVTWRLLRDPRVPAWQKAIPIGALLYIISPLDLIPDFLLAVGLIDDVAILLAGMRFFESIAPVDVVAELRAAIEGEHQGDVVEAPSYRESTNGRTTTSSKQQTR